MVPIIDGDELVLCEMVRNESAPTKIYDEQILELKYPDIFNYIIDAGSCMKTKKALYQKMADPTSMIEKSTVFFFMESIMPSYQIIERIRLNIKSTSRKIMDFEDLYISDLNSERFKNILTAGCYNEQIWDGRIVFKNNIKGQSL